MVSIKLSYDGVGRVRGEWMRFAGKEQVVEAFKILTADPQFKAILVNIVGGSFIALCLCGEEILWRQALRGHAQAGQDAWVAAQGACMAA